MANKLDIKIDLPTDDELRRMFDAESKLDRYTVVDGAVRVAAKPVVKRAKQLAPRSTAADRRKRSRKQRSKGDWNYPLWKSIAYVVRKYRRRTAISVIGPRWPKGNKAYFNTSPGGRKQVLWGNHTGKVIPQISNWIKKAFDETRPQQLSAMKSHLKSQTDKMWKDV